MSAPLALGASVFATALSAGLYALCFPPLDVPGLAALALAPWFVALRGASARRAAGLGALWGIAAAYGVGVWFPGSIASYFAQPLALGIGLFVGVASLMVVPYTVAFALLCRALSGGSPTWRPIGIAAAWAGSELLRGRLLGGIPGWTANPWGISGYAISDFLPIAQLASLTGVYGLSFCVGALNAALAELALGWREASARRRAACAALAPGLAALSGAALLASAPTGPGAGARVVAIAQGNVAIGAQWRSDAYGAHFERYLALSQRAFEDGRVDTIVWPESALSFFLEDEPSYQAVLARLLHAGGAELLAGGPRKRAGPGGTLYFNTVFRVSERGELLGRYDKQRLLPLAETTPLADLDPMRRSFGDVRSFSPGTGSGLLSTRLGRAGILVCNEAMLPEVVAQRVAEGAELLVNPSNDTWISHAQYTLAQARIAALRAVEQRRYLVRASTAGPSLVVDPWGRVQVATPEQTAAALRGAVEPRRDRTLYSYVGDAFGVLCLAFACLAALRARASTAP